MPYLSKRKVCPKESVHEAHEANARHNNKWAKYYHNKQWKLLREWQITNYPLCYDCALNGRSRAATQVHHIKPFAEGATEEERMELLLSPENITSLCEECHHKRHKILRNQKK